MAQVAVAVKFLVVNDVHLDIDADPSSMPMIGQETTPLLFQVMMEKAASSEDKPDAILLPGDLVRHGMAAMDTNRPN